MSKLRYLKIGSALVTTGFATTVLTNSIIFADSDPTDDDSIDKQAEKSFDSFKKFFNWSRVDETKVAKGDTPDRQSLLINELSRRDNYQAPKYVSTLIDCILPYRSSLIYF